MADQPAKPDEPRLPSRREPFPKGEGAKSGPVDVRDAGLPKKPADAATLGGFP